MDQFPTMLMVGRLRSKTPTHLTCLDACYINVFFTWRYGSFGHNSQSCLTWIMADTWSLHFVFVLACKQWLQVQWNQSIFTVFKPRAEVAQSPHLNSYLWASIHFVSVFMSTRTGKLIWTRFTSSTYLNVLILLKVCTQCRLWIAS